MAHGDALPEQSTTKLERAQWDFDRALLLQKQAETAARETDKAVIDARAKLESAKREAAAAIPVDRSQRECIGGADPHDADHRELKPNGQQRDYVVLSAAERAKGFIKPVRRSYIHLKCGTLTTMGRTLAKTYARDPGFYSGTFCCGCGTHFTFGQPDGDFVWDGTDERLGL